MRWDHVIFDLDGTLVDSAADIEATLAWAFAQAGWPATPLTGFQVGPPLEELVRRCAPPAMPAAGTAAVVAHFRARYDALDFTGTRLFEGVEALVDRLAGVGVGLSVATLKRAAPTEKLLRLKGLWPRFRAVECVDSRPGAPQSKQGMIERLCRELGLAPARTVMVGDTPEDLAAARGAGVQAAWARYGYGEPALALAQGPDLTLERPAQLWDAISA